MYTRMEVKDGTIVLHMDRVVSPPDNQSPIVGFAIAGKDRRFQPANKCRSSLPNKSCQS